MVVAWWTLLPFVLLLAVLPLVPATEKSRESSLVKLVSSLILGVPIAVWFVLAGEGDSVTHALIEYFRTARQETVAPR